MNKKVRDVKHAIVQKVCVISQIILNFNFSIFQYQQHIPTHMHIAQYGQVKHNSLTN